ncbi:MAG: leucyl/phenylalanyl-tRNA--protein transferase [Planctomycetaceae bacterium]
MRRVALGEDLAFPDPAFAPRGAPLAYGGNLSRERLLAAYARGIFPWYGEGEPILWWSPDPRFVLYPDSLHLSRSLRRTIRSGRYEIRLDTSFREVIRGCATATRPRGEGTWITAEMAAAYLRLHESGHAHSAESWQDGVLAGGLYGVSLGGAFFGESMFSLQPDASKAALAAFVEQLRAWGFRFVDCQTVTRHLGRLGAVAVPRARFLSELADALERPNRTGRWRLETGAS